MNFGVLETGISYHDLIVFPFILNYSKCYCLLFDLTNFNTSARFHMYDKYSTYEIKLNIHNF